MNFENLDFTSVSTSIPNSVGDFLWKTQVGQHEVIFPAKMRERSAGLKRVVSPEFDHWNGYKLILPEVPLFWANAENFVESLPPKAQTERKILQLTKQKLNDCPFCKCEPVIEYGYQNKIPQQSSTFKTLCCHRVNSPVFKTIDALIEDWNTITA